MKTDKMETPNKNADSKLSKSSLTKEKKLTHLYFNDKYLKKIPKFTNPQHALVLYLHNNEIHEITGLEHAHNLTSLYLQNNRILRIENLSNLKKLKKLYLGHNTISVVEGLQNLQSLEVFHIEKQCLFEGNSLCFDPRSINALSHTLQILNISYNKIQTISSLAPLKSLRVFSASHNELSNIDEVCGVIKDWFYLKDLVLASNPICKNRLYKEEIIANAYCLDTLDQKNISDHTRNFLKRLHGERIAQRLHKSVNLANKVPDLSKNYSSAIQKAVSISILKQSKELNEDEIFDEKNAVYIPWRTLPKPQHVAKLRQHSKNQKKFKNESHRQMLILYFHI
ncbi:LOW QUALITY PROTEIN: protein phosphatase 1 regulatory subunit 42-like [Tribolium madens]|uniref:LOW QUALITY PROTEIN: protein phosphatase 1 regulatory subunit 42-like n=1 Tax=Tribolium madens TaxID=41895 RepID=UPI001CF72A31|nr:LOW QUALITY PROTEIN: protein phosphatase 1 regulatory subunit 42-like [Tribolium madens]